MMDLPADNRFALRLVARACRKAALGTLLGGEGGGAPYVSLATLALDHDLAPVLLLSGLSDHTRNLTADPRVSLLFDGSDGFANPQAGPRVTLTGVAARTDDPRLAERFLARHPGARLYAGFGDFGFWRVEPERAHFVGGFGRAVWFPAPLGLDPAVVADFRANEAALVAEANAREAALLARLGGAEGEWRLAGLDPDGADLVSGETVLRVPFPRMVASAGEAMTTLSGLCRDA